MTNFSFLQSSLEYVEIEMPLKRKMEMRLVAYLLENSALVKKLTLFDGTRKKESRTCESVILKPLLTIPRLSSSCQVVVLITNEHTRFHEFGFGGKKTSKYSTLVNLNSLFLLSL